MPFKNIIGQPAVKEFLRRSRESGRLGHAHLFLGPEGVGKASMARAFAAFLGANALPDLLWLTRAEGAAVLRIAQARELKSWASFKTLGEGWKVAVVEDAHLLNEEAQNALLKVLEEPPDRTVVILIAPSAQMLLPTIVSRCRTVRFGRLLPSEVEEGLRLARPDLTDDAREVLARVSEGSIGRAVRLAEEGFLESRRLLLSRLGTPDASLDWGLPEAERDAQEASLELLSGFLRDIWILAQGMEEVELLNPDLRGDLEALSSRAEPAAILDLLGGCLRARTLFRHNINGKILWPVLVNRFRRVFQHG